jgi:putative FmdB family regulatory protein
MPLYEYECLVCAHHFERIQRVSDDPVATCPECGGAVHRLLGVPALQFKGSGWYVTDYGKGSSGRSDNGKDRPTGTPDSSPAKPSEKKETTGSKSSSESASSKAD